jgi:cell pole-organizing protein PopZ
MTQSAKAQEPSMEEILASIRRIIADDDASKASKPAESPAPKPAPTPPRPPASKQDDIDAMLAEMEIKVQAAKPPPPKSARPPADVLHLTEAMAAPTGPPRPAPNFRTIDGNSDVIFTDRPPEPAPARAAEEPRRAFAPSPAPQPASPSERLLSTTATAAVDQAFNTLARIMLLNNARTLEDLVKEMLRPMLKNWLDDNLPGLVERIVRAEIERVSRGRP